MARLQGKFNFVAVLGLLLAGVIMGIAAPTSSVLVVAQIAVLAGAVLIALDLSGLQPSRRRIIRAVALLSILGAMAGQVIGSDALSDWSAAVIGTLLAGAGPVLVFLCLRRSTATVSLQTVAGVLSIYLMIGLAFAALFGIIEVAGSGPIFVGIEDASTSDRLYFSFVTLATVGYGDLVPATQVMRAAAVAAAIIGQIYLVSIVAVVVSNLGQRRREPPAAGPA